MRSLILSLLFVALSVVSYGQTEDCNAATMLGASDLTSGTPTVGATTTDNTASGFWGTTAPLMANSCDPGGMYIVDEWYRFDVTANNDITVELTAGTPHMAVILEASTANCGIPNMNNFLACHDPATAATNPQTFHNCFSPGTYYIVVLTSVGNEGAYDLTVTEENGSAISAAGDNCALALALPLSTTDGTTITCGADNVNGTTFNNFQEIKGDNSVQAGCIEANEATIWYSFTAGDDVYIENITSTNLSIALYSGICGGLTLEQCATDGNISLEDVLVSGDTYYIQVAYPYGEDATFDFCINSPIVPTVDDCNTPEVMVLTDGSTTSAVQMDNLGSGSSTESFTPSLITACGSGSMSTNYYQFTIGGTGNTNLNINYNETGANAISNSQITVLQSCADTDAYMNYEWTGSTNEDICLMPGSYLIQIASCDLFEGTFTLDLTPNTPPTNDECAMADLFIDPVTMTSVTIVPAICETYNVEGTTMSACPEATNLGSTCAFDSESTVWYTFTTSGANNQLASITLNPSGVSPIVQGNFALFSGTCASPILVGTCQTDGLETDITLTSNTTYFILVSQDEFGTSGTFDLDLEISSIPTNDDCDLGTNPDILLANSGTTNCADFEFTTCSISNSLVDHQVFYTYTNMSGSTVDLEITIEADMANNNPATQVSITAIQDNCSAITAFYPGAFENSEWCDVLGAGMQTLPCIENNETVVLVFSSLEDEEGDFTIMANEGGMQPIDMNDECNTALDITPANTCVWETVMVDNNNACPEDFGDLDACSFSVDPVVWYSFTVPVATGTYQLEIQNIEGAGSYLTIFDETSDCDNITTTGIGADCEMGAGPHGDGYSNLMPGATYLIAFGNATPGMYSFDIKINLLPPNNECANAEALTLDVQATNASTICATPDVSDPTTLCDPNTGESSVWYSYEVVTDSKTLTLSLTGLTSGGDVNIIAVDGCNSTMYYNDDNNNEVCNTGDASLVIDCPVAGTTIYFMVTTSETDEGDYTLTLTETQTIDVLNDDCADAIDITPAMTCADLQTIAMTNETACPENFDIGNCGFNEEEVVWFSVDIPMGATTLDLGINSYAGLGTGFFSLFTDCNPTQYDGICYTTISNGDFTATEEFDVSGLVNTTIFIAFGSSGVSDIGGDVVFDIRLDIPPVNDECANAIALSGGVVTDGTTLCATQPTLGEYNSTQCTDADETNTVFYTYEVPDNDKGFHVTITSAAANGFTGDVNLVVFEDDPAGSCATGPGAIAEDEVCTISTALNDEFECIGPGTYVIRVSTSADNEGDFQITITPIDLVQPNDNCDAPNTTDFAPALECEWMVIDANTTGACPEHMDLDGPNCGLDDFPVTWYEVTAPANAEFLDLQINSGGINPFISVFNSGVDCDILTNVAGSTCYQGTFDELNDLGQAQIIVTPGTSYLIAIGTNVDAGANINFGIKWITPPDNDDCDMAEVLTPGGGTTGPIPGTTQCATVPITGSACDVDKTNTVWYSYTVEADVKEITIDITNWNNTVITGTPDFSVAVYDGCNATDLIDQADGSPADYCGGEGTDLITLSCLDEGDEIFILVSSSSENEGTFDITLNTLVPDCTYTNDECVNASPLTGNPNPLITDDPNDCVLVAGCNDLACSDIDFPACAGIDQLNTVFYTFTTDADVDPVDGAFVNIEILNGQAGELDAPGAVLFEGGCVGGAAIGACASGTGGVYNSGPLGGPGMIQPNTTYTIMVFNSDPNQNGGTFDLCVTVTSGCVNDDICDAFTLEPGVPVDNPASSTGCTPDFDVSGCGAAQNEATLWYQVVVPEGATSIGIMLTNQGTGGVTGDVSIAVGPLEDCNNLDVGDVLYTDCSGFGNHNIPCVVEYGTYWIQIGSEDEMEAGDFTITYIFNSNPDPANDLCSTAEDLVVTDICEFVTFPGTLTNACPEIFDFGTCEYSVNQSVWYTITIPAGPPTVTDMDIEILGLANPMIGVFEFNCANAAGGNGIINSTMNTDGTVDCSQMPLTEGIVVTPGTTYHILVSSSSMEDVGFDLSIRLNAPPINDDPCINSTNPPFDLTGGGSHSGTTCCARGAKDTNTDGSAADWENQAPCNATTEDAAVWYMFTPDPADDGYDIVVNGGSISNQMTVQVYTTTTPANLCDAVPTGNDVIASSCSNLSVDIRIPNCNPSLTYFVKVTTSDDDCGEFDISVNPANVCDYADVCEEAIDPLVTVTQESCEDPLEFFTVPGCLDLACPDPDQTDCMQDQGPTVWFKINIDDPEATKLITQVDAPGFEAVWQVFEGTSCADMMPVTEQLVIDGTTQTYVCSSSDGDIENIFQTPIDPDAIANGLMYWVSVTAVGEITDPNFDFVYNSTLGCLACTGADATDCGNGTFVASVLEDGVWVEVPDDFQFCQGIDVQVCFEFNYNTTGSGNDWIHGFVPFFGAGWDVNDDVLAAAGPLGNFEFFSSQGDCAPFLNGYNLPNVCTYIDDDGFLQLCNSACDPAGCPCTGEGGMQDGDPLPSGFWYNTPGGGSNCGQLGCTPASFFGWPSGTNVDVSECIELKTRVFDTPEECEANNSLSFGIQTFSDAVSGCWVDSSPCIVDPSVGRFDWVIECNVPPAVDGMDAEICDNGMLDIFLVTVDNSPTEIQVDVIENNNVEGELSHTFPGGSGTIDDVLDNTSSQVQIVEYIVFSVDPTLECPGPMDTIEVTIYPELIVEFDPVFICEGDCTDITPNIIGGAGMPYMYEWSTGESTSSINVCPIVPTTYFVTVTDILGCEGIGEVEVDVKPPVELLLPESIAVCKDDNFDPFNPDYFVCLDFLSGSAPFVVDWITPIGLDGEPIGLGDCFAINEVTSSAVLGTPLGVYTLTANVTDFFGCMASVDMEVTITGELTIVPDVIPYDCGETQASMNVTGIDAVGNPVTTFLLFGGCPDDDLDFLDEYFSNTGTVLISPLDLLQYDCYTIVAQTESGCQATINVELPISEGTPIDIGGDEAVCIGEDATITISNASDFTSFVWTPDIGNTGSITFTPDSSATYIVEATDALGCVSTNLWTVDVNPEPTITLAGALEFCENGTATITASGGVSYEWTGVAGAMAGPEYTTGLSGDATVTVTDINGCVSDSTITFDEVMIIEILLDNANICDGMGDTLFVPSNIINVEWLDDTPSTVSDTNFYVITTAGSFTVTGQDATTGCDAAGSFTVEEFITPFINIPDTVEVCRQDSGIDSLCIDLIAIASGSATGTWSQDGIIPDFTLSDFPLNNVCFEGIQTGCYPFTFMTNSAQAPCMDVMETMMVCVKACPCPSAEIDTVPDLCNLGSYNLELEEITQDPGTWSVITGPLGQNINDIITGTTFTATGILEGEYIVRFTLDNPGGGQCEQYQQDTFNVVGQELINVIAPGQLCNIDGQQFPTNLDLYDLISVDASNGGTWMQIGTEATIDITGGSMISSSGITDFSETFTFVYTSGNSGGPCPPTETEVTVNIFDCTCPILIVGMDTLCNDGLPIDLFTLLTNDDNLSGTWTTSGTLEGASMFNPDGLSSGPYDITYTLDSNPGAGCETDFSNIIIVRKQGVANIEDEPQQLPCSMDTGNGPTTVNLYDWLESGYTLGSWSQTGGDNLTFSDDGNSIAIVDFDGQDIDEEFTFEFTTVGAQEPCVNTVVEITIEVQDCNCPPIGLSDPDPICNDAGTLDLCSLIGSSDPGTFAVFDENGNDVSSNIDGTGCIFDATDLDPENYTIVYTLDQVVSGTCEQSDMVVVEVIEFVNAELDANPEVCNDINGNGDLTLNFFDFVSNSGDGTWTDVDGAGVDLSTNLALTNVNFATGNNGGPVPAGTYTFSFMIDNAEPCGDVNLQMDVIVTDDCNCPSINPLDPADICSTDGPLDLTQYDDPDMPGTWSSEVLTVENGNSLIIDGVTEGTYELIYTLDNPLVDCEAEAMVSIMIGSPSNPGTPLETLNFCEGDDQMIVLDDRLDGAENGGVWTETSSTMSTGFSGNTFNTVGQAPGTYTFQYTIEFADTDPCPAVDASVTIVIDPNPISDAGDEMFIDCVSTSANLGGSNTSMGGDFAYSWTLDGAEVGTTATLAGISTEGTYTLLVTNTVTGCTDESSVVVIKSDDLPTFEITEIEITCNGVDDGAVVIFNQTGGDGNYTYSLNGGDQVSDPESFTGLTPGEYTITIMDGVGCTSTNTFEILEPAPVSVAIAGEDIVVGQPGDEFTLTIDPVAENIDSVVWTDFSDPSIIFCSGSAAECSTITLSTTEITTTVYVEVFDANGCSANDQVQIQLNQIVDVVFPNIITPNGDNVNDFFYIPSKDVAQVLSMRIFDRWGELIWENSNFDPTVSSEVWNGKFNGDPVVPGVYVFTADILFNDPNNTEESFSGDITVTDGE